MWNDRIVSGKFEFLHLYNLDSILKTKLKNNERRPNMQLLIE